MSPDENVLLTSSLNLVAWDLNSGTVLWKLNTLNLVYATISPGGTKVVSAHEYDFTIINISSGKEMGKIGLGDVNFDERHKVYLTTQVRTGN